MLAHIKIRSFEILKHLRLRLYSRIAHECLLIKKIWGEKAPRQEIYPINKASEPVDIEVSASNTDKQIIAENTVVVKPAPPIIWENFISLNSDSNPKFELLEPANSYVSTDTRLEEWATLNYAQALLKDTFPLPSTQDREGYYGNDHFSYWASGLLDARLLIKAANEHGIGLKTYLDIGCASGRVLRHIALECIDCQAIGCDINRLHVEWCNAYLPDNCMVFQNHSIPTLPLEDNSVDLISGFSVFTHIEALETAWLMEIKRVLKPGGLAWLTVHTEHTLSDMDETWPLWLPTMSHPARVDLLDNERRFLGDRMVLRWHADRSYSSNVFYKSQYLVDKWSRILELVHLHRRLPSFQDVMLMRKPKV